jgi:hypothetical protein
MKKYWMLVVVLTWGFAPAATRGASLLDSVQLAALRVLRISGGTRGQRTGFGFLPADDRQQTLTRTRLGLDATIAKRHRSAALNSSRSPNIGAATEHQLSIRQAPQRTSTPNCPISSSRTLISTSRGFGGIDFIRLGRQYVGRPGDFLVYYGPVNDNVMSVRSLQGVTVKENLGACASAACVSRRGWSRTPSPNRASAAMDPRKQDEGTNAGDVNLFYALLNSDQQFKQSIFKTEFELGLLPRHRSKLRSLRRRERHRHRGHPRRNSLSPCPGARDVLALSAEFAAFNAGRNRETVYDTNDVAHQHFTTGFPANTGEPPR